MKSAVYNGITMVQTPNRGVVLFLKEILPLFNLSWGVAVEYCDVPWEDIQTQPEKLVVDIDTFYKLIKTVKTEETELFLSVFRDKFVFGFALLYLVAPDNRLLTQVNLDVVINFAQLWQSFIDTRRVVQSMPEDSWKTSDRNRNEMRSMNQGHLKIVASMLQQLYADRYGTKMPEHYLDEIPQSDLDLLELAMGRL